MVYFLVGDYLFCTTYQNCFDRWRDCVYNRLPLECFKKVGLAIFIAAVLILITYAGDDVDVVDLEFHGTVYERKHHYLYGCDSRGSIV
jgi:hypothetical protein